MYINYKYHAAVKRMTLQKSIYNKLLFCAKREESKNKNICDVLYVLA